MATRVTMPKLGESITEGTVARWLKQPGERVERLEPLLEISTDKIDTEIPSPADGQLLEIRVAEGQTVAVGTLLALIGASGEATEQPEVAPSAAPPERVAVPAVTATPATPTRGVDERPSGRGYVSPVVRRLVAEHRIDLAQVPGSGLEGRVTKQDVLAWLESPQGGVSAQQAAPLAAGPARPPALGVDETLQPLSAMRRAIAQHMVKSVATAPHVTTVFEVEMTAVVRHRERFRTEAAQGGITLTFTPYFVAAAAQALRAQPLVNSRYSDAGIITGRRVQIGVAVAVEEGLLVPVVRNADELTLSGIARVVGELAQRARAGSLTVDDVAGATFTITNHGVGGSLIGTPIIAQPQSAILGVGAIVKRPIVVSLDAGSASLLLGPGDAIVIRPMAYLSLTFDHRLLDGAAADAFVSAIKRTLEGWPQERL